MEKQTDPDLVERIDALEREVTSLRERFDALAQRAAAEPAVPEAGDTSADPLWFVNELGRRAPGAVMMAGAVEVPAGPIRWQYGLYAEELMGKDWGELARPLEALGHPVRLELVRIILAGTQTTAELLELEQFASSGQLYHHLRQLVSAGWLTSPRRGVYEVPGARIIPLLVLTMIASS
jgi:hypothetical protein